MAHNRQDGSLGYLWFYALLGSVFSALALISLVHRLLDIGLVPVMQEILDYYRGLVHPIMHWLLGWVRWIWPAWDLPEWLKDVYALSFVGGANIARGVAWFDRMELERGTQFFAGARRLGQMELILSGLVTGATFFGLLMWLMSILALVLLFRKGRNRELLDAMFNVFVLFPALTLVQAFCFFAVNSQL